MGNEPITLKIKTLTPLWTGGSDGKMDRVHETGIIGSIRWWYEVIARGLGYYVCDPTDSDTRCPTENKEEKKKEYCPACLLFGATGYRRRFRISISHPEYDKNVLSNKFEVLSGRLHGQRNGGWFIYSGCFGKYDVSIESLDNDFDDILIQLPLKLAANWGALGAKPQLGYGVFSFGQETELSISMFTKALARISSDEKLKKLDFHLRDKANTSFIYPSLKEMFFAKIRFLSTDNEWWKGIKGLKNVNDLAFKSWIDNNSAPISPTVKNWFRYDDNVSKFWKTEKCREGDLDNWLFGTIRDERIASKINISGAYHPIEGNKDLWEFRIWGWIPLQNERCKDFKREEILNRLKKHIANTTDKKWQELLGGFVNSFELHSWREFNSVRDTFGLLNNMNDFIDSLIDNVSEVEEK